ncbi:hypothetical protein P8452_14123 [Trifolium repens]|nr:hypothetical protein P8452_14123 [Trifolium repens]
MLRTLLLILTIIIGNCSSLIVRSLKLSFYVHWEIGRIKKSMKFLTQLWQLIISYNVRKNIRKWIDYFPQVKS